VKKVQKNSIEVDIRVFSQRKIEGMMIKWIVASVVFVCALIIFLAVRTNRHQNFLLWVEFRQVH